MEYPPLLHPALLPEDFPTSVIEYLKERQTEICAIDGVGIGVNELSRLLHVRRMAAYMNDSIMDALAALLNVQEGFSNHYWLSSWKGMNLWIDGSPEL